MYNQGLGLKDFLLNICIKGLSEGCDTQEELDKRVEEFMMGNELPEMYKELVKIIPNDVFNSFVDKSEAQYKQLKKDDVKYRNHLEELWGEGFKLTNAMYEMALEVQQSYSNRILEEHSEEIKAQEYKCKVMQLIADRNLQTFSAIFYLICNGFGDQAFMLFRNMFENRVISKFVFDNNEETAKAFYKSQYEDLNSYKDYEWVKKAGNLSKVNALHLKKYMIDVISRNHMEAHGIDNIGWHVNYYIPLQKELHNPYLPIQLVITSFL